MNSDTFYVEGEKDNVDLARFNGVWCDELQRWEFPAVMKESVLRFLSDEEDFEERPYFFEGSDDSDEYSDEDQISLARPAVVKKRTIHRSRSFDSQSSD